MDTMIFQQTFTITSDGVQADNVTNIIPCSISSADGYNNYQPTPATGDEATRIKSKIDERSAAIPTADSTAKSSGDTGSSDTVSADDASGSTDTSDESESDTDSDFQMNRMVRITILQKIMIPRTKKITVPMKRQIFQITAMNR